MARPLGLRGGSLRLGCRPAHGRRGRGRGGFGRGLLRVLVGALGAPLPLAEHASTLQSGRPDRVADAR
ncbi:hypothetical protein HMPREF0682_1952 [Propionibacterium acidifaciens F0233]|uniref:Uncharacterized protein n=1 Tax=Propionibacterium acidifaciens F0233 TaxID=553198 RepID=U2PX97_9ACTN|nr:hypothetical protein HMPREF0682_1952 [Propionibacterium acidifaciens F0233]